MTFKDFMARWYGGSLVENATWRAYDFEGSVHSRHVAKALKLLGLDYAGEHAMGEFMARYGIRDRDEASTMVGAWWLLTRVELGRTFVKKRIISTPSTEPSTTPAT